MIESVKCKPARQVFVNTFQKLSKSIQELLKNYSKKTIQKLYKNYSKTIQKLFQNYLKTIQQLFENYTQSILKLFKDYFKNYTKTIQKVFKTFLTHTKKNQSTRATSRPPPLSHSPGDWLTPAGGWVLHPQDTRLHKL